MISNNEKSATSPFVVIIQSASSELIFPGRIFVQAEFVKVHSHSPMRKHNLITLVARILVGARPYYLINLCQLFLVA